jgi:hypothetical protein
MSLLIPWEQVAGPFRFAEHTVGTTVLDRKVD